MSDLDMNYSFDQDIDSNVDTEVSEDIGMLDSVDEDVDVNFIDELSLPEVDEETEEDFDGDDSPKTLTMEITPEILESRANDTEETLDMYRDNLRSHGVDDEKIEEFVNQEREKIYAEYESLDRGDTSSNIYYQPTNWGEVADNLMAEDREQFQQENTTDINEQTEEFVSETNELDINYEEIYEGMDQEAIEQGIADTPIDIDTERLDSSLENFDARNWENLSIDEQKDSMGNLADYVVDAIGFENPPTIEYYNNPQNGDYGGYDSATNTLRVNEHMLYDSDEAADTIAHELWHAHQHECAMNPQSTRDYQYQYNFNNYISPSLGQDAYEAQLVEAEARAFAAQFKDRLSSISGRSR